MKKLLLAAMIAGFGLLGAVNPGHHYHHYGPKPKADMYAAADMYSLPLDMH